MESKEGMKITPGRRSNLLLPAQRMFAGKVDKLGRLFATL
jgi:hypothetical protein